MNQTEYLARLLIHEKGHYLITIITKKNYNTQSTIQKHPKKKLAVFITIMPQV